MKILEHYKNISKKKEFFYKKDVLDINF